jgi:hypothetical protein
MPTIKPVRCLSFIEKINKLNKAGNKRHTTTWSRSSKFYLVWLDLRLQSIMESNMFLISHLHKLESLFRTFRSHIKTDRKTKR